MGILIYLIIGIGRLVSLKNKNIKIMFNYSHLISKAIFNIHVTAN